MRRDLPTGTVTFVFTDIEGSTRMLEVLGADAYGELLARHHVVCRAAWGAHGGVEVDTAGDAFFVAFPTASGALAAAGEAQAALTELGLRVRMGVHTGEVSVGETGYVGFEVHRAARIAAAAHGGQVVVSAATAAETCRIGLVELGEHRFKDVAEPLPIFQLGKGSFPPLKTLSNTNLPRPASSFVGRERELAEVVGRIERGARLVTLTGPGGSGKTRLALESASTLVPEFKAGVFWVGLAALRDPTLVTETIAQTLGAKDGLAEHIGGREMLLLLDNLEQVIEAAPDVSRLLRECPSLTLVVTSRELLRVDGEVEYAVPPLAEPEAVALFCERAQSEPSGEMRELCARLDNLPLAVELAAARTKALSPAQILERLSQRLDLLKGGRDADPRQQTLRATIEWSYDLLTSDEQRLFRALSVFVGGCTLEAAEEVAGADLDTLQSLVERSLLRFTNTRYWMLETIREYGEERARESNESDQLGRRHRAWFVQLARESGIDVADPDANRLLSGKAAAATMRLAADFPNVRQAVAHALNSHEPDELGHVVASLFPFLITQGHLAEAREWVEAALGKRDLLSPSGLAAVLLGGGEIVRFAGDSHRAAELKREALVVMEDVPDFTGWIPFVLADLCDIALQDGDLRLAREYAVESTATGGGARAAGSLAELCLHTGDLESAESHGLVALASYEEEELNHAAVLETLGEVARRLGDDAKAHRLFCDALRSYSELGDGGGVADCLDGLSRLAVKERHMERAGRLRGAAQNLREAWGRAPARADVEWPQLPDDAQSRGSTMNLEEAVRYALESID